MKNMKHEGTAGPFLMFHVFMFQPLISTLRPLSLLL